MPNPSQKIRIAAVGATGFSGEELVRILADHPNAELAYVSGRSDRSAKLQEIYPDLEGKVDLECRAFDPDEAGRHAELVFLALPHRVSAQYAGAFLAQGKRVIDISADFRLADPAKYPAYYGFEHPDPASLKTAVYGLPELFRERISKAVLLANPGCYPTGAALALLPLVQAGIEARGPIVVDAASGVTGAGRGAKAAVDFAAEGENFKAYKVERHSHEAEIGQFLGWGSAAYRFSFVPHLLPVQRGILTTAYVPLGDGADEVRFRELYEKQYAQEPFVTVLPKGEFPDLKSVQRTNQCRIGLTVKKDAGVLVVISAIDNLTKGASGQAVQNMNLMYGLPETAGLS